ncbi:MAG: hypothetical protein KDD44_11665 [Bdellovibrionales bacterium]|nr:hypothetical protein [Bdellovibrionales bacterium]
MTTLSPEISWAAFPAQSTAQRRKMPRVFPIYVAAYLPHQNGRIDWAGFKAILTRIYQAVCVPVINADTGFAFLLNPDQKREVIRRLREWFPDKPVVVGVTPVSASTFSADAYMEAIAAVQLDENVRIMMMVSPGLTALHGQELVDAFASVTNLQQPGIAHELTAEFVTFGRPFTPFEIAGILALPNFSALKTSALSGCAVLQRVTLIRRMDLPEDRQILSGVDWQVGEAFEYADGVLMGAAALFPRLFRRLLELRRDADSDPRSFWAYDQLIAAVQAIVSFQFRPGPGTSVDVGGYRHFTGIWLKACGVIGSDDLPAGVPQHHQRGDDRAVAESLLLMLRTVLKGIGEDPNELLS